MAEIPKESQELWRSYTENFSLLEDARREWVECALRFLNELAKYISSQIWAKDSKLNIKEIKITDWLAGNFEYRRYSNKLIFPESQYRFQITIGLGKWPNDQKCVFYTYVSCKLENGAELRKKEKSIVQQFVEGKKGIMDPESPCDFYYRSIDASNPDLSNSAEIVKETLKDIEELNDILVPSAK